MTRWLKTAGIGGERFIGLLRSSLIVKALALASVVVAMLVATGGAAYSSLESSRSSRPNVILILVDDLDETVFERSTLNNTWVPQGMSFTKAFDTTAVCCPSRASILRGQYAHNTGLVRNRGPHGGSAYFRSSGLDRNTIATTMRRGGYKTWFGGKYFNAYKSRSYVPPGWTRWQALLNRRTANVDGRKVTFESHHTDWLSNKAVNFIKGMRGSSKPFFMYVAPIDMHTPLDDIPKRHRSAYKTAKLPTPPSYNEKDVSDKPEWVRRLPRLSKEKRQEYNVLHRKRMQSALTIEDLSRDIISALKRTGQLNETYLIFTSDNGYHMGLHRITIGKHTPYTEAHEVPFVVRGPGVPKGAKRNDIVANIDIAPTVASLGNVKIPAQTDGRSIEPFLRGSAPQWRDSLLIEAAALGPRRPEYAGVRQQSRVYVRYKTNEEEYYDLRTDPYQLRNRPRDAPQSMKDRLAALRNCARDTCRRADHS